MKPQPGKVLDSFFSAWIQYIKGLSVTLWGRVASNRKAIVFVVIIQSLEVVVDFYSSIVTNHLYTCYFIYKIEFSCKICVVQLWWVLSFTSRTRVCHYHIWKTAWGPSSLKKWRYSWLKSLLLLGRQRVNWSPRSPSVWSFFCLFVLEGDSDISVLFLP